MKKVKRKAHEKTQDLHMRVTTREKNRLVREASELGVNLSEYLRPLIFEKKASGKLSSKAIQVVALCQDLVTYVQEKYSNEDDIELLERMDALWKIL